MKKYLFLIAVALIAGFVESLYSGSSLIVFAAAGLYADPDIGLGKFPVNHPLNHTVYRSVELGPIPFGRAVMDGTNPDTQIKLFSDPAVNFRGIAANYNGLAVDGEYSTLEGADVVESGIVNVKVLEAVDPSDPVRIRHVGAGTAATASSQTVDGNAIIAGDATGLANDATEYTEDIKIGSDIQSVLVVGSQAQTFTTLLAEINAGLAGAQIAISGGDLVITADVAGTGHDIEILAGGTLFNALTKFIAILDPVAGVDAVLAADTVGAFCTAADAAKTAVVSGAEFRGTTTGPGMVALFLPAGKKTVTAD